MRRLPMLLVLVLLPAGALAQEAPGPAEAAAIRQVIQAQLDAFQRDAAGEAFGYASPMIRRKFGDPANFMRMVRRGYRPVYRPRAVEFRNLTMRRGQPTQEVFFIGPDGRAVIGLYLMERQPSGEWRIDGVILTVPPDLSV